MEVEIRRVLQTFEAKNHFFQKKQVQPGWHSDGHPLMWTAWPPWGLATSPTRLSSKWVWHSTFFQFNLFVGDLLTIHSPGPRASFREVWRCWRHLLANWKGDWQVWTKVLNRFEIYFLYFQVSRLCLCSVLRQARCRGESWPYGLPGLWLLLLKSQITSKIKNLITYTVCIWLWANV